MLQVRFPSQLLHHFNVPRQCDAEGETVADVLRSLEDRFPGLTGYLLHENGSLRQHVNLFLDQRLIQDREKLSDSVHGVSELFVMQALSGG